MFPTGIIPPLEQFPRDIQRADPNRTSEILLIQSFSKPDNIPDVLAEEMKRVEELEKRRQLERQKELERLQEELAAQRKAAEEKRWLATCLPDRDAFTQRFSVQTMAESLMDIYRKAGKKAA